MLVSPRAELSKVAGSAARHGLRSGHLRQHARQADDAGPQRPQVSASNDLGDKDRFALMNFATTVTSIPTISRTPRKHNVGRRPEVGRWPGSHRRHRHQRRPGRRAADAHRAIGAARSRSSSSPTASRPSARPTRTRFWPTSWPKNTANTRIFTFGVGDDVNAALLDQLADKTRAVTHLCPRNRRHRGQGQRSLRQNQQSRADQPEAECGRRRQA